MTKRYLGNIITQNPTAPAGDLANSSAKGVWSLEEQLAYQKAGLWPVPGKFPPDVEDVFSTYLYTGNATERDITTGIDLAGEGGLLWIKNRSSTSDHSLFNTVNGARKSLNSNSTQSAYASTSPSPADKDLKSFNSDGFSIFAAGYNANLNVNSANYTSWAWRKAPKFFDVVTYSGTGVAGLTVDHNLGSVPGMIIVKSYDDSRDWAVYHRGVDATNPEDYALVLQSTVAREDNVAWFNDTAPTDTQFTVGNKLDINRSGYNYVAYLFAHNDGDGGFGPAGDADIIKCGSFSGAGATEVPISLGFEPQWFMVKKTSASDDWYIIDVMRGQPVGANVSLLIPNSTSSEVDSLIASPTADGLITKNFGSGTYIYMAIRRGTKVPESGTEVFDIHNQAGSYSSPTNVGFPVDLSIMAKRTGQSLNSTVGDRLRGSTKFLSTSKTNADDTGIDWQFDLQNNFQSTWTTDTISWMWKRAPGYFDAVAYTGTGVAGRTVSHNLGVAPEMMWVKSRSAAQDWDVYHAGLNGGVDKGHYKIKLNSTGGESNSATRWNDTAPAASNFTVGTSATTNGSGSTYIAYLFASLPGISKVGSYTGTGATLNIDCGFTSGARFVLIKRTDAGGQWLTFDSVRGIAAGNDPVLFLNSDSAEDSGYDIIDPYSSGFTVTADATYEQNISGGSYIFYAIA